MQNSYGMNRMTDKERYLALERYFFELESDRAFRRMRLRAFLDSFRRVLDRGKELRLGGQSLLGRRSTDALKTLFLPIDGFSGYVEADGRVSPGMRTLARRFLPLWSSILERGGADSLPPPRAYRVGGNWYLESGCSAILALEAARALEATELRVAVPLRALEEVGCAGTAVTSRGRPPAPPSELLAG
jgi:hypothetical protein